jgi:hypothetical protein
MVARLRARSISRPVREHICAGLVNARVLAAFEHAVDLVDPEGTVVALVTPQIGDGPLNVVVDGEPGCFAGMDVGMYAALEPRRIAVGGRAIVSLAQTTVWEPRPDWGALRARRGAIVGRLPAVRAVALRQAPRESLLAALDRGDPAPVVAVARDGLSHLRAGRAGDVVELAEGARRLAGLGAGLTPAGDDFLVGLMLRAWLEHPDPESFCRALAEASAPWTTVLSAALLRAAARGECAAAWHALLVTLDTGISDSVERSAQRILAHGATSGADALAGFLWDINRETTRISSRNSR